MPTHYGGGGTTMRKKSAVAMSSMRDTDYYKEHSKHHSPKHIRAMKELQRLGVDRMKAHNYVKKYIGK